MDTPKILIVEDLPANNALYREVFTAAGFTVMLTANADDDFVAAVAAFAPDIISMDIMIGSSTGVVERDGFDAIALLKADARTAHIPIIVLTNFSDDAKIARAKALGAVDYIVVQGQSIKALPERFNAYLKSPRRYQSVHPAFRS